MASTLRPINWYNYNEESEEIVINPNASKKPTFSIIFDFVSQVFWYILFISFPIDFYCKYFIKDDFYIGDYNVTSINKVILEISGSFRCILWVVYITSFIILKLNLLSVSLIYEKVDRLLTVFTWMCYCYYLFEVSEFEIKGYLIYVQSAIIASIITSAVCMFLSISMFLFENRFLRNTIKSKILEVSRTEKILKKLKKYAYDIEEESEISEDFCKISELFCLNLDTWSSDRYESNITENISFRDLKDPEIFNLKDAIKLSKDVFKKASSSDNILTRDNFVEIFGDEEYAGRLFTEFDINHSQKVSKENFCVSLGFYFRNRALLSKALVSTCNFVNILKIMAYTVASVFLAVIFMFLFGVNIKEMFALVVSSALAIGFLGSGMIKDMWRNIMFLISHQFDIGDDVIIDDKEMVVHDIGLVATTLLLANGGTIKLVNCDLWGKLIVNMTKAPEKILLFTLNLPSNIDQSQMHSIKSAISEFVKERPFEFHDTFVVGSQNTHCSTIKKLETSILLKFKTHTNRSKKFTMRAEFTAFIKKFFKENDISVE